MDNPSIPITKQESHVPSLLLSVMMPRYTILFRDGEVRIEATNDAFYVSADHGTSIEDTVKNNFGFITNAEFWCQAANSFRPVKILHNIKADTLHNAGIAVPLKSDSAPLYVTPYPPIIDSNVDPKDFEGTWLRFFEEWQGYSVDQFRVVDEEGDEFDASFEDEDRIIKTRRWTRDESLELVEKIVKSLFI